ncbi:MFS transporter [Demequina activiva]|uniref:Major facilitator superfamily (MFS) profile domain-containing protein n=1 Tax=Demequina activiva TaxID=1582364 RepID=A0A919PYZ2_9MICO|nr:MFS transporter [Demequina activiva]GIG53295.1 hypothetical protein Dac01nite_00470 [Demequina activiva]
MSDSARTVEIDVRPVQRASEQAHSGADDDAPERTYRESDPTTLSIPLVTGAQAVVLEEPVAATRTIESLMISSRRAKLALLTLAVSAFAFGANEASVVAMSSDIATGLGVPVASVGLLATAFALTVVIAAIPLTLVTRRWSRRASVTGAIALWSAGVLVAANADTLAMLTTGRVVSAGAHALFWAIVAPTAASLFAPHLRARTVTAIMLGASAAGVLGTPLVSFAGTSLGWQVPYWALGGLGVLLVGASAATMPAARGTAAARSTVGDLPSGRAFARVLVVTFLATVGMSATWTYIVPFYTGVAGLPSQMLPALFALGGTLAVATTLAVGRFLTRYAVRTVLVGTAMLAAAWGLLALGQGWSAIAAQAIQAAGWAVLVSALLNWAMRHTPWRTEMGAGAYTVTMNGGAALGPLLGAAVVATAGTGALPLLSLALTLIAAGVAAGVDRRTLTLLELPRKVRTRIAARPARPLRESGLEPARRPAKPIDAAVLRRHRAEWRRRTGL